MRRSTQSWQLFCTVLSTGWMAMAMLLNACGDGRIASSEVGNPPSGGTVKGIVTAATGSPVTGARVTLLPVDFDPVKDAGKRGAPVYLDTTDSLGAYHLQGVNWNRYNLYAVDQKTGKRMLVTGQDVHLDTVVITDTRSLQNPGAISVLLPDSFQFKGGYVYLPGTQVFVKLDATLGESRLLYLDSVPVGASPDIYYRLSGTSAVSGKSFAEIKVAKGVKVLSGDTVPALVYPEWAFSQLVYMNTTPNGAAISGMVKDFPLLIRLTASDFDFSAAASDGHDIRFADKQGRPLAFEIESWHQDSSRAAIWVRLDSIQGNDSNQFFRMYWGNSAAPANTGLKAVFDTSLGYSSVWHMGGFESGTAQFKDASENGNPLTAGGGLKATNVEPSPLGNAIHLDGVGRLLTTGKTFDNPSTFTLSMWFNTTSDSGGKLIGFGADPGMLDRARDRHIWMDTTGKIHFAVNNQNGDKNKKLDILSGSKAYNDGKWHMVTGTLSSAGLVLYIDGAKVDEDLSVTTAQFFKGYWKVGFDFVFYDWPFAPKALYFKGLVDEVRVSHKIFTLDWTRLSWENQRSDGHLIHFIKN
jgi:hypothetical protein